MVKCEKGDSGKLKEMGIPLNQRKMLFYGICIWLRLGLAYLSYKYYEHPYFLYLAAIGSVIGILTIRVNKDKCVWWSRRFHHINLWLILYTVLIQLVTKDKKPIISYLLFIDVFTGILTSFFQFQ